MSGYLIERCTYYGMYKSRQLPKQVSTTRHFETAFRFFAAHILWLNCVLLFIVLCCIKLNGIFPERQYITISCCEVMNVEFVSKLLKTLNE